VAAAAAAAAAPGDAAAQQRATWLAEMYRALVAQAELCVRAQALLGDAKLAQAPVFHATCERVAAAMADFTAAAADALHARAAWMLPLLREAEGTASGGAACPRLLFQFQPDVAQP
jgi:hypothetical protein